MKRRTILGVCISLALAVSGCSPSSIIKTYLPKYGNDPAPNEPETYKARVYMDEVRGRLLDFSGSQLTMGDDEENTYVFDVSQATLECADGMITGDEISVIYQGQFSGTDTSQVKVLKVVDEYHKKTRLKDRTARGKIVSLTPNTLTIQAKSGKTATYPITGSEQYYQNGVSQGSQVTLQFKGKFVETEGSPQVLGASHLKVLSISDTEPFQAPKPESPSSGENQEEKETKQFRATILDISSNILRMVPAASKNSLDLDLSKIPCYFKGGIAPGSGVTVYYTGRDFDGSTLENILILSVAGDDPDTMDAYHMGFTVTGTVLGSTANTVTLQTDDGATITCFTSNAQNISSQGTSPGSRLRITFDPSASKSSNIYTSIKIEDA